MNKSILFVADEKQVIKALKKAFLGSTNNVFTAKTGAEAHAILSSEQINLIVVDLDMPGNNGYTVLREAKERYPAVIRLVLSGNIDEMTLLKIQKECLAKSYISKPLKNQELFDTIERTFDVQKLLTNKNLMEIINKIEILPFSQDVFFKFNTLIEQDAGMKEIAETIESDPSLTAKVLQAANSVLYGIKTGSVSQAISYLGLNNVKNIVLLTIFYKKLDNVNNPKINRDLQILWQHAVTTNKIMALLYQKLLKKEIPEVCSMAGLLHDIGKIVLISSFTEEYVKAVESINPKKDMVYYYEEMEFLEVTHSEIGGYLLEWWGLPYPIVESALFHHDPFDDRVFDRELVALTHLAGNFSWNILYHGNSREVDPKVFQLFNLTKEGCDNLLKEIEENLNNSEES